MAYRPGQFRAANLLSCYACDRAFAPAYLVRINIAENVDHKLQLAIAHRENNHLAPMVADEAARLCRACNQLIENEIAALECDQTCLRLIVFRQNGSRNCIICNAQNNIQRLSDDSRISAFALVNIYIPNHVRICRVHLDENGCILKPLLPGIPFVNRPYIISGAELHVLLQKLREMANKPWIHQSLDNLSDTEFSSLSPITKEQFLDLYTYCDPVPRERGHRYVSKHDLLMFLCKMKQGLSDDFLKVIFHYTSRQAVSQAVATVRRSLMERFVRENIGFTAITRDQLIDAHVTEFSNILYNPEPDVRRAILYVDGTYAYIQKSRNFRVLRQTYSVHKSRHLIKPALIVAPDGYILAIQGPYFADSQNNDAAMLRNEFDRDADILRGWFRDGDIFIVDRGYRDAGPLFQTLGISHKMPAVLERGQDQLSTEQANDTRLITKTRWVVEARNGHIKSMFKFFGNLITATHAGNLGEFYNFAGALINKYHPLILMEGANAQLAHQMLEKATEVNVVKARVEVEGLGRRHGRWIELDDGQVLDFPRLSLEYLRGLTFGVYQINLAASYIQNAFHHGRGETIFIDRLQNEPGFFRCKIYSRFRNNTTYQLWVAYRANEHNEENMPVNNDNDDPLILGYYCTCKSGARSLGCCGHIASVLWYLGYARNEENVAYPSSQLLERVLDAGNRPQ